MNKIVPFLLGAFIVLGAGRSAAIPHGPPIVPLVSVHPFHAEKDAVFTPNLIGDWLLVVKEDAAQGISIRRSGRAAAYRIRGLDELFSGGFQDTRASYFRVGDCDYLDFEVRLTTENNKDCVIPLHALAHVVVEERKIKLRLLLADNPVLDLPTRVAGKLSRIRYDAAPFCLLTSETAEINRVLRRNGKRAFPARVDAEITLVKQ